MLKLVSSPSSRQLRSQFSPPCLRAKSSGSAYHHYCLQALRSIAGRGSGVCSFYHRAFSCSGSSSDEVKSGELEAAGRDSGNATVPTNPRPEDYLTLVGDFNFPRLADFRAALSGANKLQCKKVLEELFVSSDSNVLVINSKQIPKKGFTKGFSSSSQPLKNPHSNLPFNGAFQLIPSRPSNLQLRIPSRSFSMLKPISSSSAPQFHSQFLSHCVRAKSSGSANNHRLHAFGSIVGLGRRGLGECSFYRRVMFWSGSSSDDEAVEGEVKSGESEAGCRDSGNAIVPTNPRPEDYLTVLALPLPQRPLFPGLYIAIYVKDPKLLAALQERQAPAPYVGVFLLKDEPETDASAVTCSETEKIIDDLKGKELFDRLHEVGTLAQISRIQRDQVILIGLMRLQITEMVSEDPLTVKVDPLKEKPFNIYDDVINAMSFEVIATIRDALKTSYLWRDHVQRYTQQADFPRLADFGAAISGANKLQCQEVVEELDVHKRLCLTLELVKREVEISKIQESLQIANNFHRPLWSTTDPREFHIFSADAVASPHFKYFNLAESYKLYVPEDKREDWEDYRDKISQVVFRKARYQLPPKGYTGVHTDGSVKENLVVYGSETIVDISNGSAAAVKRSDEGKLLNSCAMKLGYVDILTAEAEGAYLGFLLSLYDEKVQICMDSLELILLLKDQENIPPKNVEDLIFEMRSIMDMKRRNGGVVELKKVDRIGNFLADRMTQLPNLGQWANPPRAPKYFGQPDEFPTDELRKILDEDMKGMYRYAKKKKQY